MWALTVPTGIIGWGSRSSNHSFVICTSECRLLIKRRRRHTALVRRRRRRRYGRHILRRRWPPRNEWLYVLGGCDRKHEKAKGNQRTQAQTKQQQLLLLLLVLPSMLWWLSHASPCFHQLLIDHPFISLWLAKLLFVLS